MSVPLVPSEKAPLTTSRLAEIEPIPFARVRSRVPSSVSGVKVRLPAEVLIWIVASSSTTLAVSEEPVPRAVEIEVFSVTVRVESEEL